MFVIKRTAREVHIDGIITRNGSDIHSLTPIPASAATGHTHDSLQAAFDEANALGPVCRICSIAATMILNRAR